MILIEIIIFIIPLICICFIQISGAVANDQSGNSVSSAGDINGDGYDDIVIGAPFAISTGGTSYVIFGQGGSNMNNIDLASSTFTSAGTGFKVCFIVLIIKCS